MRGDTAVKSPFLAVVLVVATLAVTGCAATRPTSYYLLEPVPEALRSGDSRQDCLTIGIRPVEIPSYLDRRQILVRTDENRLVVSELDQWAEPLDESIARVAARNLEALTCARVVRLVPGRRAGPADYVLEVRVHRMEAGPGDEAILDASWRISEARGGKTLVSRESRFARPADTRSYPSLVQAHSELVGELCREVAQSVETLAAGHERR